MNYAFPEKYEVFHQTEMYNDYKEVFEQNIATVTSANESWYNGLMTTFTNAIKCGNRRPEEDDIMAYIKYQDISDEDEQLFMQFIAEIYDKLLDLRSSSRQKGIIISKKNITKNSHAPEELIKEQRRLEKSEIQKIKASALIDAAVVRTETRLHKETREDKKASDIAERRRLSDLKKEAQEIAKLASIAETVCECGFIYIFNRRMVHMGSDKHRDRMDGIQYYKQLHNL